MMSLFSLGPLWWLCVVSWRGWSVCSADGMLCSTTHVNTMSRITFDLCSMVVNSTLNCLTSIPNKFSATLPPGYPVVGYSLFSGQLVSTVRLDKPKHQGKVHLLPGSSGSGGGSPKVLFSFLLFSLLLLKICASDDDPMAPVLTPRSLQSAWTKVRSTKEK